MMLIFFVGAGAVTLVRRGLLRTRFAAVVYGRAVLGTWKMTRIFRHWFTSY